jgi:pimeloyl-ACP methyl ester carboxylesterase
LIRRHDQPDQLMPALRAFIHTLPTRTDEMERTLHAVEAPTLVAALDQDPLFDLSAARTVHRTVLNARLAVLPGDTHSLPQAPLDLLAPLLHRHYTAA